MSVIQGERNSNESCEKTHAERSDELGLKNPLNINKTLRIKRFVLSHELEKNWAIDLNLAEYINRVTAMVLEPTTN